jgi:sugar phosphate permease
VVWSIWPVWLVFAWGYVLSYALRVVNAIIGPPLMQELGLSNADLGLISAAYFITFAAMQLPLGIWLDRYGSRRTESILLLFAALGCALFASSHSFSALWLARGLIGVGVSGCLMAAMKAYRLWFAPQRQSQLGAAMLVAGTMGALCATVPVSNALPTLGWRGIFWLMAGLLLLASALLWWFLRPIEAAHAAAVTAVPGGNAKTDANAVAQEDGYRRIFADPYFRRLAMIGLVHQGSFMAIHSLWAGLWLTQVLAMSKSHAADILFVFNLCLLAAYLGLSWLAPRFIVIDGGQLPGQKRFALSRVVGLGLLASLLVQVLIIAWHAPAAWVLWPLLAVFSTMASLVQSHVGLTFPARMAGRANTAYNLLLFIGAFVVQWGIGLLIDVIKGHGLPIDSAMRLAFVPMVVVQALVLGLFVRNRAQVSVLE